MRPEFTPVDPVGDAIRFWSKVDRSGGDDACWDWLAGRSRGYGTFYSHIKGMRRAPGIGVRLGISAHRFSWFLAHGPIPDGMHVLHHCDNRLCQNPRHLFLGTNQDNIDDMVSKGRHLPSRPRGTANPNSRFTEDDVRTIRAVYVGRLGQITELAREYGVTIPAISDVVHHRTWKHVT
jgi:hypothetical protein